MDISRTCGVSRHHPAPARPKVHLPAQTGGGRGSLRSTKEEEEEEAPSDDGGGERKGLFVLGRCASMGDGGGGKGKGPSRFLQTYWVSRSICSISSFRHEREMMIDEYAGWYSSPKRRREGKAAAAAGDAKAMAKANLPLERRPTIVR